MTTRKESKRILSVRITREMDTDPDTSYYGEYSSKATSEFSIDRAHSEDCQLVSAGVAIESLEHAQSYVTDKDQDESEAAYDLLQDAIDDLQTCDCGERGDMERGQYRYFNPSFNYVDKNGDALLENTPDEVRKYVRHDYERMESLNRQNWYFCGIRAHAEVQLTGDLCQTITSGGLWGIESDSGADYLTEVEDEQLDELKAELHAVGFSKRAITAAFRNAKENQNAKH